MFQKDETRKEVKAQLKKTQNEEFFSQGALAASIFNKSQIWLESKTILIFLSMKLEIDTQPLIEAALNANKKVFIPVVKGENIVFLSISSANGPWIEGPFGIREPSGGEPLTQKDFPVLVITPGLAFDRKGNRLGKGRGYYDRFFASLDAEKRQYKTIGLCLDSQIINEVPVEKTDKKMNGLLTGKELVILNSPGQAANDNGVNNGQN